MQWVVSFLILHSWFLNCFYIYNRQHELISYLNIETVDIYENFVSKKLSFGSHVLFSIHHDVSPYIYGRNNSFDMSVTFYNDAGLRFARTNNGNNATKYNWRKKIQLTDWYNNVYGNDWDHVSTYAAANHPDMQVMWAFENYLQKTNWGWFNFNALGFYRSQWWEGVGQRLAVEVMWR